MRAALVMVMALAASAAHAAAVDRAEWDGLQRWAEAMRAGGLAVAGADALDLSTVPPGSGLALLDPTAGEIDGLRLFAQEGGRLLLAVEDPAAAPLLAQLGLRLAPTPSIADEGGHPALQAFAVPGGGLFDGVEVLLANHPAALDGPPHLDAAVRWPDGTPFAYHLRVGEGEVLVVADASVFINLMLDGGGNARFAANVGTWLARSGAAPVLVVGPEASVGGRYGGSPDDGGTLDGLNAALGELGRMLDPDDLVLHLLLAMLLASTLVYVVAVFPGGGPGPGRAPAAPRVGRAERAAGDATGPAAPESPTDGSSGAGAAPAQASEST